MDAASWEVLVGSKDYPAGLEQLGDDAPQRLFGRGDKSCLRCPCLSIIGARRATPYGLAIASMAGRIAAECGITVVSGGALGCDAAASRAALHAGGTTIIVSGVGADKVYPPQSADIFSKASQGRGAVLSERPWGSPAGRWAFPRRNRIIAALSPCLLVCEAGERSGTASTADAALRLERQVYAAPGSIFSPTSAFTNRLIGEGASIICSEQDLEMRISMDYGQLRMVCEDDGYRGGRILSALFAQPMRPDDLAASMEISPLEMLRILSDYEMAGLIERLPDGRMSLSEEAFLTHAKMASGAAADGQEGA